MFFIILTTSSPPIIRNKTTIPPKMRFTPPENSPSYILPINVDFETYLILLIINTNYVVFVR